MAAVLKSMSFVNILKMILKVLIIS